jgi:hypothetical protein
MNDGRPIIDRYRRSLSIPRRLMPSLLALHAGKEPAGDVLSELQRGGVFTATRLDPLVGSLVDAITNPTLVVTVEVDTLDPLVKPELATIWRSGEKGVLGRSDKDGRFELIQIEVPLLPFHLAQVVRLTPRSQPEFTGSFTIPARALAAVETIVHSNPVEAEREMSAAGVDAAWTDRWVAALIMRRSMWAMESIWLGDHRRRSEARLSVLDGGFTGYWRLSHEDDLVRIAPSHFDDMMHRLAALLP